MEYLLMAAACFVGGFLGAYIGKNIDKDTPLPVERAIRKVKRVLSDEPQKTADNSDLYNRWLYHQPEEVE
jgi:hypothetical protein